MSAFRHQNAERNNGTHNLNAADLHAVDLSAVRRVHLVGIGGAGLSAIATICLERGLEVSGSDLQSNAQTEALSRRGARIFIGHAPENVRGADLVLVSSAIAPSNPEWQEALRLGIPVVKRGPVLAALMSAAIGIAVAGSHGKTTTAALIAFLLSEARLDPTFIIGGVVENFGTNARVGTGPHFVLEADEYDRTFLALRPHLSIITNVEMDHPDCFQDEEDVRQAFLEFASHTSRDGLILAWADDPAVAALAQEAAAIAGCSVQTYGFDASATWCARDLMPRADGGTEFTILRPGRQVARARMALPGRHNVANGLAALAAVAWLGIPPEAASPSLSRFHGTRRRMEIRGSVGGIIVLDDYAHHPTQIAATLQAVREKYGPRPLWAVFQPHTYSRLRALWSDFATCFRDADHVLVLPVYAAREPHDPTVRPDQLAREMAHSDARYVASLDEAATLLAQHAEPDAIIITLGAGDEWVAGDRALALLRRKLAQTLQAGK